MFLEYRLKQRWFDHDIQVFVCPWTAKNHNQQFNSWSPHPSNCIVTLFESRVFIYWPFMVAGQFFQMYLMQSTDSKHPAKPASEYMSWKYINSEKHRKRLRNRPPYISSISTQNCWKYCRTDCSDIDIYIYSIIKTVCCNTGAEDTQGWYYFQVSWYTLETELINSMSPTVATVAYQITL